VSGGAATARRGALLVTGAAVVWSSGALIARLVATTPWTTNLWRSLFASAFLGVLLSITGRRSIVAQWREGGRPVIAVAACMALASTCFIFSLAHTSVANTLLLMSTSPYVVGVLGWLLLGDTEPPCLDAADADDSGSLEISDAVGVLCWLFLGDCEPPAPGPLECGSDSTPDEIECATATEGCAQ